MRNAPTWLCRKFAHQDQKIGARPERRAEEESAAAVAAVADWFLKCLQNIHR